MHRSHFQANMLSQTMKEGLFNRQESLEMLSSEGYSHDEEYAEAQKSNKNGINS